jgi:hypothetical protein
MPPCSHDSPTVGHPTKPCGIPPAGVWILAGAQFTRGGSLRPLTAGLPSLHASGVRLDAYVDDTTTSQSKRKIPRLQLQPISAG